MINLITKNSVSLSRFCYKLSVFGLKTGPHVTRYFMYKHLSRYSEVRPRDSKVLSISHSEKLAEILGFKRDQIIDASYPSVNVLKLPFDDHEFDCVVSDQVLEHVEGEPQAAINELFRVLRPNGIALHSTCFINPVHGCPSDYWRFTPDALRLLTEKSGTIIDSGGWGNTYVWPFVFLGLRFAPVPEVRWHPAHWIATYNDPQWPIVTWVLVKKAWHC